MSTGTATGGLTKFSPIHNAQTVSGAAKSSTSLISGAHCT